MTAAAKRRERLEAPRRAAAVLFAEGVEQAEIARRLKVSAASVSRWKARWEQGGDEALRCGPIGREPKITPEQWNCVEAKLLEGPEACGYTTPLWTLARIAELIEKTTGVRYHIGHLSKLMGAMGWSCQKPERRAKERNEEAIAAWVKEDWPRIKRGPKNRTLS